MVFPGQGSQMVGMGRDLVANFPECQQVFEEADDILGIDLSRICFEGPLETLTETHHAQPALLTHSIAVLRVVESRGIKPTVVAGHSLGEYSALVAAGCLTFPDALRIVRRRGELMFESGKQQPGAMAAILGLELQTTRKICDAVDGVCDVANINAPGQLVVSGEVAAVEAAMQRCRTAGARIVKRLNVSGAFHSALMQEPARRLAEELDTLELSDAHVPVVPNVTAQAERKATVLRDLLKRQIAAPVQWVDSMHALRRIDPGPVLEVGAGNVLKGLFKRIDKAAECTALGDLPSLDAFLQEIATAS
jgi:[acyl-carrier-protein] S-malonyltransferase